MLASLPDADPPLVNPAFVYEPKYDGIRAIVEVMRTPARAFGQERNEKTAQFPTWLRSSRGRARSRSRSSGWRNRPLDADLNPPGSSGCKAGFIKRAGLSIEKPILPPDQQPPR